MIGTLPALILSAIADLTSGRREHQAKLGMVGPDRIHDLR